MCCSIQRVTSESLTLVFPNRILECTKRLTPSVELLSIWLLRLSREQAILGELTGGVLVPYYMKCCAEDHHTTIETGSKCLKTSLRDKSLWSLTFPLRLLVCFRDFWRGIQIWESVPARKMLMKLSNILSSTESIGIWSKRSSMTPFSNPESEVQKIPLVLTSCLQKKV
jgi:hypothetical protein